MRGGCRGGFLGRDFEGLMRSFDCLSKEQEVRVLLYNMSP